MSQGTSTFSVNKALGDFVEMVLKGTPVDEIRREMIRRLVNAEFSQELRTANMVLDEVREGYESLGYTVVDVRARLSTRLLSGVSTGPFALMFEVGMHYHPVLNLPYVPGSSIKGVMRSNAIELCGNNRECVGKVFQLFGVGKVAYEDEYFEKLFNQEIPQGEREAEGLIVVSDAFPVSAPGNRLFSGDIVNPHYARGGKPVTNEYEVTPVPVLHVSVNKGVEFRFLVAVTPDAEQLANELGRALFNAPSPEGLVFSLLTYSLMKGVGARTSRGYGSFDVDVRSVHVFKSSKRLGKVPGEVKWRKSTKG